MTRLHVEQPEDERWLAETGTRWVRAIRLRHGRDWVVAIPELGVVTPPQRRRSAERQARAIAEIVFRADGRSVHLLIASSPRDRMIRVDDGHPEQANLLAWLFSER